MTKTAITVSVVIITCQRPDYLRRCLQHLDRQTEPADQIVVADASSNQETAELVAAIRTVSYLHDRSWAGDMTVPRNAALGEVTGDVIAYLDDDAFAAPDYLERLRHAYAEPNVALACSRTLDGVAGEELELGDGIGRLLANGDLTGHFAYAAPKITPIDHGIGATMSFRRETLSALGGFRPGYGGTCVREETDAFLRARSLGFRAVFIPDAVVEHLAAPQLRGHRFDLRYDYWYYRNHALLLINNYGFRTPLLRRWITQAFAQLARDRSRSVRGRVARLIARGCGLLHGTAVALAQGHGRILPPVRDDADGRLIRNQLADGPSPVVVASRRAPDVPIHLGAYLMVGDVKWIAPCFRALYGLVDQIVISYDERSRGYSGDQIDFAFNLALIRALDIDGKAIFLPGRFFREECDPMENETNQRRVSLDAASVNVDWVIQLDTDEVLLDPAEFIQQLRAAHTAGREGLEYPARWLYADIGAGRYLERSRRFGGIAASYPGAVAVRAGAELRHSRQGSESLWRVDFRSKNTDPWHGSDSPVDAIITPDQAIAHFSWVRSREDMRAKARSSAHANHLEWDRLIARWLSYQRHPLLAMLISRLRRDREHWMRITQLPDSLSLDRALR